jgi:hypothetical protein
LDDTLEEARLRRLREVGPWLIAELDLDTVLAAAAFSAC